MFYKKKTIGYKEVLPGVLLKTLAHGQKTLLTEFKLTQGTVIPEHHHSNEQTGYLGSGAIILTIDGSTYDVLPGDSWCIESNLLHSVQVLEKSVVVEVFSPVREDYLPENLH